MTGLRGPVECTPDGLTTAEVNLCADRPSKSAGLSGECEAVQVCMVDVEPRVGLPERPKRGWTSNGMAA